MRKNRYGDYFDVAKLDEILSLMNQAHQICPELGDSSYVRAGYLMWAGRISEARDAYRMVAECYPSYSLHSTLFLAQAEALLGNIEVAKDLLTQYNHRVIEEAPYLPQQSLERLGIGDT